MQGSPTLQVERGGKGHSSLWEDHVQNGRAEKGLCRDNEPGSRTRPQRPAVWGRVAREEAGVATCRQRPGWQVRKSSLKCSPSQEWGLGTEPPSPDSLVACSTGAVGSTGTEGPPPLVTKSELCPPPLPGLSLAPTTSGKHQICVKCAQGQTEVARGRHLPKSE